jgi:hypothetical protein
MKSALGTLAGIAAFLIVFIAGKYGVQKSGERRALSATEQNLSRPQTEAPAAPSGSHPPTAIQQEATKYFAAKAPADGVGLKKQNDAADAFWAFYFINTRGRYDVCQESGVDIRAFVDAFARVHLSEYAKAKAVYLRSGSNEEKVYLMLKPSLNKIVLHDMGDMSAQKMTEACQLLVINADAMAADMHISRLQPAVFEVLSGVQ